MSSRNDSRKKRHRRIRKNVAGTGQKPRLCVFRSNGNIYAQVIDDTSGRTLVSASTLSKDMAELKGHKGNIAAARAAGELLGKKALKGGIRQVVFDRGGYLYHGRVKALADGAREAGLQF